MKNELLDQALTALEENISRFTDPNIEEDFSEGIGNSLAMVVAISEDIENLENIVNTIIENIRKPIELPYKDFRQRIERIMDAIFIRHRTIFLSFLENETLTKIKELWQIKTVPIAPTEKDVTPDHKYESPEIRRFFLAHMYKEAKKQADQNYGDPRQNYRALKDGRETRILKHRTAGFSTILDFGELAFTSGDTNDSANSLGMIEDGFKIMDLFYKENSEQASQFFPAKIVFCTHDSADHWITYEIKLHNHNKVVSPSRFQELTKILPDIKQRLLFFVGEKDNPREAAVWKLPNGNVGYLLLDPNSKLEFPDYMREATDLVEFAKKGQFKSPEDYSNYSAVKTGIEKTLGKDYSQNEDQVRALTLLTCWLNPKKTVIAETAAYDSLNIHEDVPSTLRNTFFKEIEKLTKLKLVHAKHHGNCYKYEGQASDEQAQKDAKSCGAIARFVKHFLLTNSGKLQSFEAGAIALRIADLQALIEYDLDLANRFYRNQFLPEDDIWSTENMDLNSVVEASQNCFNQLRNLKEANEAINEIFEFIFIADNQKFQKECAQLLAEKYPAVFNLFFEDAETFKTYKVGKDNGTTQELNASIIKENILVFRYTQLRDNKKSSDKTKTDILNHPIWKLLEEIKVKGGGLPRDNVVPTTFATLYSNWESYWLRNCQTALKNLDTGRMWTFCERLSAIHGFNMPIAASQLLAYADKFNQTNINNKIVIDLDIKLNLYKHFANLLMPEQNEIFFSESLTHRMRELNDALIGICNNASSPKTPMKDEEEKEEVEGETDEDEVASTDSQKLIIYKTMALHILKTITMLAGLDEIEINESNLEMLNNILGQLISLVSRPNATDLDNAIQLAITDLGKYLKKIVTVEQKIQIRNQQQQDINNPPPQNFDNPRFVHLPKHLPTPKPVPKLKGLTPFQHEPVNEKGFVMPRQTRVDPINGGALQQFSALIANTKELNNPQQINEAKNMIFVATLDNKRIGLKQICKVPVFFENSAHNAIDLIIKKAGTAPHKESDFFLSILEYIMKESNEAGIALTELTNSNQQDILQIAAGIPNKSVIVQNIRENFVEKPKKASFQQPLPPMNSLLRQKNSVPRNTTPPPSNSLATPSVEVIEDNLASAIGFLSKKETDSNLHLLLQKGGVKKLKTTFLFHDGVLCSLLNLLATNARMHTGNNPNFFLGRIQYLLNEIKEQRPSELLEFKNALIANTNKNNPANPKQKITDQQQISFLMKIFDEQTQNPNQENEADSTDNITGKKRKRSEPTKTEPEKIGKDLDGGQPLKKKQKTEKKTEDDKDLKTESENEKKPLQKEQELLPPPQIQSDEDDIKEDEEKIDNEISSTGEGAVRPPPPPLSRKKESPKEEEDEEENDELLNEPTPIVVKKPPTPEQLLLEKKAKKITPTLSKESMFAKKSKPKKDDGTEKIVGQKRKRHGSHDPRLNLDPPGPKDSDLKEPSEKKRKLDENKDNNKKKPDNNGNKGGCNIM